MKKPSIELFELIKSLSKGEKVYFKKFSQIHSIGEKNKYVLLFDAIASQKEYDEAALIRKLKGKAFASQFPAAKNYLYHQILKSLMSCHQNSHSEVRDLLHSAEILYEKGFDRQSYKILLKAKQIAAENEMHWAMLEIFRFEETNFALKKLNLPYIENIRQQKTTELNLLQNTIAYRDVYFEMYFLYVAYGRARKSQDTVEMKKIINSKLLRNESTALTFESKLQFYYIQGLYRDAKGNPQQAHKYTKRVIDLFHANPRKISGYFITYITWLTNLAQSATNVKKYKEVEECLYSMKQAAHLAETISQKTRYFYFYHILLLDYFIITGRFENAINALPAVEAELSAQEKRLSDYEKLFLYITIALAFFGAQKYHKSIFWINRIRNEISINTMTTIQSTLHIFHLIAHYEAGNMDILPYLIQSVYRFLLKKERIYKFETILLHFLRNELPNTHTRSELMQAFQRLKTKMVPLAKDPYEKNALRDIDFISWLDSKIQNRSFAEVVRQKAAEGGGSGKGNG